MDLNFCFKLHQKSNKMQTNEDTTKPVFSSYENLSNALREMPASSKMDDAIYWLNESIADCDNPVSKQIIMNLINKLQESKKLMDEAFSDMDKIVAEQP
jgi:hypothetical protein